MDSLDIFSRLGWFFKREKWAYITGATMLVLVGLLAGIVPMIIAFVIDGMTDGSLTSSALMMWVMAIIIISVLQYALRYVWRINIFGTSAKLEKILRQRLFNHFTKMDSVFYQKYRTGDLMAHATNDLGAIRMVAGGGILTMVDSLTQGLITLFMMFWAVDWQLSLMVIIPLPILAVSIRLIGKKMHFHFRRSQEAFSSLNDKVQESVTGIKVIKTFGEEELDSVDFRRMTEQVVNKNKSVYFYDALFRPTIQLVMGVCTIIGLFYGGFLVMEGQITVGLLVAFLNYITRMSWPMVAIGRLFNIIERGSASYNRIMDLLKEETTIVEASDAVTRPIDGEIEFAVDNFTYPQTEEAMLQNIHFTIPQGHTLGIVGKTGSGKTSIFKLLMRDYDQYKGSIRFNGIDTKAYALDTLLGSIGYVPQDNFLFSTTVRDNIRFADPDASQERVEEAARLTSVHQDIIGFPEGYDTLVGERGVALSGGQKQRISMARAIINAPSLLILDDSLSAVDAKTEEAILSSIKTNRQNKTTIISAHRISSVMHANEIIVLDKGEIVERGNHYELLEQDGWYKQMYEKQQLETLLNEGGEQ